MFVSPQPLYPEFVQFYLTSPAVQVLRLFNQPLENVVTTGVTTATVEAMEAELKRDLLREREKTGGKVLLVRARFISYAKFPILTSNCHCYSTTRSRRTERLQ